jgi:competence protein ComGC
MTSAVFSTSLQLQNYRCHIVVTMFVIIIIISISISISIRNILQTTTNSLNIKEMNIKVSYCNVE